MRMSIFPFLLIVVVDSLAQNSPWVSYGPPGQVTALALSPLNPSIILAGTHMAGVFRSTDRGESWQHSSQGIPLLELWHGNSISRIVFDPLNPNIIYVGTGFNDTGGGKGLYKSTDGGQTWKALQPGSGGPVLAISINPRNPSELFVTVLRWLFRSRDGGETFAEVLQFSNGGAPYGGPVAFDHKDSATVYTVDDYGNFYKSVDGGDSWNKTSLGRQLWGPRRLIQDESNGGFYIYCHVGVFLLTDRLELQELTQGMSLASGDGDMLYDNTSNTFYLAASNSGLFKSTDRGQTWENISREPNVMAVALDKDTLYAGTAVGVYKSIDSGKTWRAINKNLAAAFVNHLAVAETDHQLIYAATGNGVFRSTDGGRNWRHLPQAGGAYYVNQVAIDPIDKNTAYAAFGEYYGTFYGIFKTTDGGKTWTDISPASNFPVTAIDIQSDDPRVIYIGAPSVLAKSENGGMNWEITWAQIEPSEVNAVRVARSNPKVIYFGLSSNHTGPDGIRITEDGGETWERRMNGFGDGISFTSIISLAVHPFDEKIAYAGNWFYNIYRTTDLGRNWKALAGGLPSNEKRIADLVIHRNNPSIVFAAISGYYLPPQQRGIYKSADGGEHWERLPESDFYNNYVTSLKHVDANGREVFYVGTYGQGIFTNAFLQTNVKQQQTEWSERISLRGNYPNPFNVATIIEYELPIATNVSLKIYNANGQEVRTVAKGLQVGGLHSVRWDGKNDLSQTVSSGIYIYRLQVGNYIESKKMLLLR